MKFLIVAPRFHTNLYYRTKALQDAGHFVRVVVLYKGKSEYYDEIKPLQVKLSKFSNIIIKILSFIKKGKLKSNLQLRLQSPNKEFKKIISIYNPDVILLKAYQNTLAIKTLRIAKKYNVKVLMLTQTNFTHIKGSKFLFKLNIKFFNFLKVHAYITPLKSNYEAFKDFGIKNVFYVPFVFPLSNQKKKNNFNQIKILSIGKFQKRKDQLLLLKAFNTLKNQSYKIKLCLIGEAANKKYLKVLHNFIKENNLLEDVCIETNLPYSQILNEYKKHNLFVLPAYNEPAAYSPVEALGNGLPVICSNQNGTACYIKNNKNGFVFEAKNENDLTEKIRICISDKNKLNEMKKNAYIVAKENHSLENFSKKIVDIVK